MESLDGLNLHPFATMWDEFFIPTWLCWRRHNSLLVSCHRHPAS